MGRFVKGWRPDLPDFRDKLYMIERVISLPNSIDLRPQCPPVFDQGQLGSCVANALTGVVGFLQLKDNEAFQAAARLFIYYNARAIEGTIDSDSGATIRDGIKSLVKLGVCSEAEWPYDITQFAAQPTAECFAAALQHKLLSYQRLTTQIQKLHILSLGNPIAFGFSVYSSFESPEVASTGIVPMPQPNEQLLGGHAVVLVGYDRVKQLYLVRNSWGTDWGLQGYFWMPFGYVDNLNLADDFWTISKEQGF